MSPRSVYKFFGVDPANSDAVVQNTHFEANRAAFFNNGEPIINRGPAQQSMQQAQDIFWGNEQKVKGKQLGAPIPGTATFQPRIEADAIFACTFQAGTELSKHSVNRINDEKADTLKTAQQFLPYQ